MNKINTENRPPHGTRVGIEHDAKEVARERALPYSPRGMEKLAELAYCPKCGEVRTVMAAISRWDGKKYAACTHCLTVGSV